MLDALLTSQGWIAYLLVLAALLGSAFGLPIPEDVSLIISGILVASDNANLTIMLLVCYFGIIAGDLIIYRVGWIAGPRLFRKRWFKRFLTTTRLQTLRSNLEKRTFLTIVIARHLFYLRTATFLVCGAVRVSFSRFLIADAIAALITTPVMLGLGYLFGEHYDHLMAWMREIKIALVVLGLATALYLYWRFKRNAESESDVENPDEEDDDEGSSNAPSEPDSPIIH